MAEVSDPGPAQRGSDRPAGPPVHGVFGRIPRHRPALRPHSLHPVDGQLRGQNKPRDSVLEDGKHLAFN